MTTQQNLNQEWASLIVEELIRNGADYFCLAPGSRSTPLALAVANNKRAKSFVHFDERGVAFHALGYSSATSKPSVIITTSGSAVANLFPAVLEASKKKAPIIILTADRPPELRFTGDNQVIDQIKIFGDYVRWFFDLPTPTASIAPEFVLTTIDQAIHRAQGELKGPVHINCMFREPLIQTGIPHLSGEYFKSLRAWRIHRKPYTQYAQTGKMLSADTLNESLRRIKSIKNGIIAAGKLSSPEETAAVLNLAKQLNWPIFPDVTSGLRLTKGSEHVVPYFDLLLSSEPFKKNFQIDGVLHLGGRLTSKRFYDFIKEQSLREYITVLNHPLLNDPQHSVTLRIQSSVLDFSKSFVTALPQRPGNIRNTKVFSLNQKIDSLLNQRLRGKHSICEAQAVRALSTVLPQNSGLFLGNSLPIREMDIYGAIRPFAITVGANRGASGIDGTIASAVGFAIGIQKPTTVLLGDLAFLYDLNSLAMCQKFKNSFVLVVLNNNGGGIFQYLPIAKNTRTFEDYFATPHGLSFESAAKLFKLSYSNPKSIPEFKKTYLTAAAKKGTAIIEITTNREENISVSNSIRDSIRNL